MTTRVLGPLVLAGLLVAATATPGQASSSTLLSQGHVDVLDIGFAGGALTAGVLADTDTGSPGLYDPDEVVLVVPPSAALTVPSAWDICVEGTSYILPQNRVSGLLWGGWNADDVASGAVTGNQVTITLTDVDGPQGSDGFCVFTASGGQVSNVYLDSDDLGTSGQLSFAASAGGHAHANWGFDVAGSYEITVEVSAVRASDGTPITTGELTYTFDVG